VPTTETCRSRLRQIRRTRRSLDQKSAATLVHAFVTSRVDYCNTLLTGAPKVTTDKLQRVLNAAARVLTGTHKFDRGLSRLLHTELHWLDIPEQVTYKLGVIMFGCQHGRAPPAVSDRLLSTGLQCGVTSAPPFSQSTSSGRTASPSQHVRPPGFCCGWPHGLELHLLNNIQDPDVRSIDNFKRLLKTFLFLAYQCN